MFSCAWRDSRCRIGLILGTGTNACYLEDIKNIGILDPADFPGQEHMVINTEWGAFGDNGELDFVRTKWDKAVDDMSVNPGKQIFEKMISGKRSFPKPFNVNIMMDVCLRCAGPFFLLKIIISSYLFTYSFNSRAFLQYNGYFDLFIKT